MTTKEFIKLFIPPICFKIRNRILCKNRNRRGSFVSEKVLFHNYIDEVNRRSFIPFNRIDELSKNIGFDELHSITIDNAEPNYYGSYYVMQEFAGIPILNIPPAGFAIQHGILYEMMDWIKRKKNLYNLVWSKKIKEMMEDGQTNPKIIAVGAPFFYAKSLLNSNEIKQEKQRIGYNLLAFPMHSSHFINTDFETDNFIRLLKQQKNKFDSIRVCLYWKDIQRGTMKPFIEAGFECVCCGHMFDLLFLKRLRSLLEISDATISNGVGSHIGYSIYFNKPHRLLLDKFNLVDIKENDGTEAMGRIKNSTNYKEICKAFVSDEYVITDEQRYIVDKYWGTSAIKTSSELKHLLTNI